MPPPGPRRSRRPATARRPVRSKELVGDRGQRGAQQRPGQVDPEASVVGPPAMCGRKAAGGVHRGAGDRAAEDRIESDRGSDRKRGKLALRARVSVATARITEHEKGRQHGLPQERGAIAAAWCRRSQVSDAAQGGAQEERRRRSRPRVALPSTAAPSGRGEVASEAANPAVTAGLKCAPRDMPECADHDHDHQAEAECDAEVAEGVRVRASTMISSAACEDERECPDQLSNQRPHQLAVA